jgi:hypothetical protein
MVTKFVLSEDQQSIVGTLVLFGNSAHKRIEGEKEELGTFKTEGERIEALDRIFGITLSPAQRAGIRGLQSALSR